MQLAAEVSPWVYPLAELATDSERQTAKDLVNSMSSADMKKIVTDMLNKQEAPPTDELMKLLPFIVPWAVFLLMSLIGWMFYCCYCICDEYYRFLAF